MSIQKQTSKQYFRSLTILYFGLLIGQVAFAAITLYLNLELLFQPDDSLRDIFIYIVPIFVVNGFATGHLIYKSRLKKIKKHNSLTSKMGEYRGAMIIRLAMLEGASLFAIVVYLLTADLIFIAMSGLIIAFFIILRPTSDKISMDLELNSTEKLQIENPNEIIAEFETNP
jgi:MFS family permease